MEKATIAKTQNHEWDFPHLILKHYAVSSLEKGKPDEMITLSLNEKSLMLFTLQHLPSGDAKANQLPMIHTGGLANIFTPGTTLYFIRVGDRHRGEPDFDQTKSH